MDVLSFVSILLFYIWVVLPGTEGSQGWKLFFILLAVGICVVSLYRRRVPRRRIGMRLDNLGPALVVYFSATLLYAGVFLYWHRDWLGYKDPQLLGLEKAATLLLWAFVQEFCLLAFLLYRLRQITGGRLPAVLVAASIFALLHLPNPFLMVYTLGGGVILTLLFQRVPNLLAATLAHATATAIVAGLLPAIVTGHMKVGPGFW